MFLLKKLYSFLVDTFQTLALAAVIFLVIYFFLFRPFQVSGESMYPTFKDREYILTNLIGMRLEPIKRGDVVVFESPTDPDKDFIKRIIGLPGDTVWVQDGSVYVNGKKLDEGEYLKSSVKTYGESFLDEKEKVHLADNEYFVMGDNRPASSDSREWGPLKRSAIIGKSFFVYWPIPTARAVSNPYSH